MYDGRTHMHSMVKYKSFDFLKNATLRVVIPYIDPPNVNYVNFSDAAAVEFGYGPGVIMEILKDISESLNLSYKIINTESRKWGMHRSELWTEALGKLLNGEADILVGATIMEYDRCLKVDFSYPFQSELTGMLIYLPEEYESHAFLIVTQPFGWEVWVATTVLSIVSGIVLVFLTHTVGSVVKELQFTLFEAIWVFFSIFVQQGLPNQPRSWSVRVLIALWWLASITLMATFTGSLVALFAVDKIHLPFQNIEQLVKVVKQGKYTLLMDVNSLARTEMIARSQLPTYRELWYEISVNHQVKFIDGIERGVQFLRSNPGYVLLGPMNTLGFHAYVDCRLVLIQEGILPSYLSIALAKDSPYSAYFSSRIRELVERGFTSKWESDYRAYIASKKWKCNSTNSPTKSYLDITRAQGAFWILLCGLCLGIAIFLVEFTAKILWK